MLRLHFLFSAFALTAAAFFAAPTTSNAATALMCDQGTVSGSWILPKDGEPGKAAGKLVPHGAPDAEYVFNADLIETPLGCHLCIGGLIEGKLEVLATGVVYRVSGSYEGTSFGRRGTYHMNITTPITDVWVGELSGNWQHKLGKPYGPLDGTFQICP